MVFTTIDQSILGPYSSSASTFLGVGRNRIINGEMMFDQANGGGLVTTTNNQVVSYVTDEFWQVTENSASAGTFTGQRVSTSPPTGFNFYYHIACTVANTSTLRSYMNQAIEGYFVRDVGFGGTSPKSMTLSFWTRSNLTGTFGGVITSGDGQRFYIFSYTINNTNTWEYKTITFTGDPGGGTSHYPTNSSAGLLVRWGIALSQTSAPNVWTTNLGYGPTGMVNLLSSTSNFWDITGVQLEIGTAATPFEYRPFALDLMLCQRYFEKSYDLDVVPGTVTAVGLEHVANAPVGASETWGVSIHFAVPKRAVPGMTLYNGGTGAIGTWSTTSSGGVSNATTTVSTQYVYSKYFGVHNGVNNSQYAEGHWTADARL